MGLFDNLGSGLSIQPFLIKSKSIQWLLIGGLVPPEPFTNTILNSVGDIIDVIVFLSKFVICGNGNDLPVQFTIINHGKHTQWLDLLDGSHIQGLGSNLNNINRIIITEALQLGVLLVGVLPSLGKASVVPEDGAVVIPEDSLLDVLRDGVVGFFGGDLHLGLGHFGDFNDGIVGSIRGSLEGDVVPGGDGGIALVEGKTEGFGGGLAGGGGGVAVEDGGGDDAGGADDRCGLGAPCRGAGGGEGQESEWGEELHGGCWCCCCWGFG
mmetsp:Transcript_27018/g.46077  ORF Transcript_27018/g.46077 Transcript_27018/m.46077 type:complete len:267 (-) Transcript_27018:55-855(-)